MISGDSNVANENATDKTSTTPVSKISSNSTKGLVKKLKKDHDKFILNADKNDTLNNASTTTTTTENTPTSPNILNGNLNKNERSHGNIQSIFSFKLKPHKETTRRVRKMEDDENFINLIELDDEDKTSIDVNNNNNSNASNKEKKKQIQFNIDPNLSTKTTDSKSFFGRRSSVHEKLNQLKVEAIKKRRLNAERKESLEKNKVEKKGFDFEKFFKNLESTLLF